MHSYLTLLLDTDPPRFKPLFLSFDCTEDVESERIRLALKENNSK